MMLRLQDCILGRAESWANERSNDVDSAAHRLAPNLLFARGRTLTRIADQARTGRGPKQLYRGSFLTL